MATATTIALMFVVVWIAVCCLLLLLFNNDDASACCCCCCVATCFTIITHHNHTISKLIWSRFTSPQPLPLPSIERNLCWRCVQMPHALRLIVAFRCFIAAISAQIFIKIYYFGRCCAGDSCNGEVKASKRARAHCSHMGNLCVHYGKSIRAPNDSWLICGVTRQSVGFPRL